MLINTPYAPPRAIVSSNAQGFASKLRDLQAQFGDMSALTVAYGSTEASIAYIAKQQGQKAALAFLDAMSAGFSKPTAVNSNEPGEAPK